jgi:hypothetical protein
VRTLFIIAILFLCLSICHTQVLVSESKLWSNLEYGTEQPENQNYQTFWIKFEGDSLIHDTIYKKVFRSDDSLHATWISYGFIREDSSKRVYIYGVPKYNTSSQEELLYDFSLKKGDSISIGQGYYLPIDSVGYITLENKTFKTIYISSLEWIEGIGSLDGIFYGINNMLLSGIYRYLVCYFENGSLIYHNNNYNSCFIHHLPFGYGQMLKIRDVFDFQKGDEFQYKTTINGGEIPNADRITVVQKTFSANNDSITYTYHHDRYSTSFNDQNLEYSFDAFDTSETYTNLDSPILNIISADFNTYGLNLYQKMFCDTAVNGFYIKEPNDFRTPYIIYEYGKGLGLTSYVEESEGLMDSKETTMFYFNKQGVKCGVPDLTTSIDMDIAEHFEVFPNPAQRFINLKLTDELPFIYTFYNLTGDKISSGKLTGRRNIIALDEIPRGVYILQIDQNNKLNHQKIIKL